MRHVFLKTSFLLLLAITLVQCKKNNENPIIKPDQQFYVLTSDNKIAKFNANNTTSAMSSITVSGLQSGEKLMSIDFRPATGQLYALGSSSRLYFINMNTGAATALGTAAFTPAISGTMATIDFNPTVDRIRLVTNTGQNLRLHPETGIVAATDGSINGATGASISNVAYTESKAGATSTILYDIDATNKKLYKQDPPNNGTLVEVGSLNVNFTANAGFDIKPDNSLALAVFTTDNIQRLYQVNLTSGVASYIGDFSGMTIVDIAIQTDPVAYGADEMGNLIIFNPTKSSSAFTKAFTGLQTAETIVGLDFRPANGQLYALGSSSRIYTINTSTGAATVVGGMLTTALAGTSFGFDFNPTVDRIRIVSNTGQNLRVNPNDGTVSAVDGSLNPGTPNVNGAAYTNSFAGSTTTTLFVTDATTGKLYTQNPPNNGTLVEVGSLGISISSENGFDIGGTSNTAYIIATVGGATKLYTVNTTNGTATASIDMSMKLRAFAVGSGF